MSRHFFPYPRFALLLGLVMSLVGFSSGAATFTAKNLNDNGPLFASTVEKTRSADTICGLLADASQVQGSGCCSSHNGVCGCSGGRSLCCDGTLSPTCTCTSTTYSLSITKTGSGDGTVSGDGSYGNGDTVTLTATPVTGSTFIGWSPSPCAASFVMPANNLTCTATFTSVGDASKTLITHYYQSILSRVPDPGGLAYWQGEVARLQGLGVDVQEVFRVMAGWFFYSAEYLGKNTGDSQYVTDLYRTFFRRDPDGGGLSFWTGQLAAGMPRAVVLFSFLFSSEFGSYMQGLLGTTASRAEVYAVVDFYRGFLNRLADDGGFGYWIGRFRAAQCQGAAAVTAEVDGISTQYLGSAEYAARNRSNRDYVADLYYAFLRRGGELTGFDFWVSQLDNGLKTREQLRKEFLNSPEFQSRVQQIISQGCLN